MRRFLVGTSKSVLTRKRFTSGNIVQHCTEVHMRLCVKYDGRCLKQRGAFTTTFVAGSHCVNQHYRMTKKTWPCFSNTVWKRTVRSACWASKSARRSSVSLTNKLVLHLKIQFSMPHTRPHSLPRMRKPGDSCFLFW